VNRFLTLQSHPDFTLNRHWNLVQVGLFLLPFSSFLGGVSILVTSLVLWVQHFKVLSRQRLNWGFALLSGWMILSAILSVDPPTAYLGLFNFIPFFITFAALSLLIQTPHQLRQIAQIFVLASIPVSLIGFGQFFLHWGGNPSLLWGLIQWSIDPQGNPLGRMSSVFTYANVLASYNVIIFVLSIGLWMVQKSRWIVAAGVLNAIALILTNSRNAWGIAAAACLAFALYQGWRLIVAGVMGIISIVLGAAFAPSPVAEGLRTIVPRFFWARLNDQMYSDRPIEQLRSTQWKYALSLTEQRPITGWGLRTFEQLYQAKMQYVIHHPHNLLLMLLAETGIPGAFLLFGLVGWVIAKGILYFQQLQSDQTLYFTILLSFAACTVFCCLDITLFDARINLMGWILLAGIWGLAMNASSRS
jgi:O-antigen ligase